MQTTCSVSADGLLATYRVTGMRYACTISLGLSCLLLGSICMYGAWLSALSGLLVDGAELCIAGGVMMYCVIAGFGSLFACVTLYPDRLEWRDPLGKSHCLLHDDISGFRKVRPAYGLTGWGGIFLLESVSMPGRRFTLPRVAYGPCFYQWLSRYPDQDQLVLKKADEQAELDARLGASPDERLRRACRLRAVTRWVHFAGLGLLPCVGLSFCPPDWVGLVLVALPWCVLALIMLSKGRLCLYDADPVASKNKGLMIGLLLPSAVYLPRMLLASFDQRQFLPLSFTIWLVLSLVFGMLCLLVFALLSRGAIRGAFGWGLSGILMVFYAGGTLGFLNGYLDHQTPKAYRRYIYYVQIIQDRRSTRHALRTYNPDLTAIDRFPTYFGISDAFFQQVNTGDTVCFLEHPGALYLPWSELIKADKNSRLCGMPGPVAEAARQTPQQDTSAFTAEQYRMAAAQGQPQAAFKMGEAYASGYGVEMDPVQAAAWFRKAADLGDALAQNRLGEMYRDGVGVGEDPSRAVELFRQSALQGLGQAQCNLGSAYASGYGAPRDPLMAMQWYARAANQGDAQAQYDLGELFRNGIGVRHDISEAARWFRLAAAQGNAQAVDALGKRYAN
jgi:hypothetical protein